MTTLLLTLTFLNMKQAPKRRRKKEQNRNHKTRQWKRKKRIFQTLIYWIHLEARLFQLYRRKLFHKMATRRRRRAMGRIRSTGSTGRRAVAMRAPLRSSGSLKRRRRVRREM